MREGYKKIEHQCNNLIASLQSKNEYSCSFDLFVNYTLPCHQQDSYSGILEEINTCSQNSK